MNEDKKVSVIDLVGNYPSLIGKVLAWADDRNFFDPKNGATEDSQVVKLIEECGELCEGIAKTNKDLCLDGLGDAQVVLINIIGIKYFSGTPEDSPKPVFDIETLIKTLLQTIIFLESDETFSNESMKGRYDVFLLKQLLLYAVQGQYTYALSASIMLEKHLFTSSPKAECLQVAYNEIKDRKGKFINNTYVKEADLKLIDTSF